MRRSSPARTRSFQTNPTLALQYELMAAFGILSEAEFDQRCTSWQFERWKLFKVYRTQQRLALADNDPPLTPIPWLEL